MFLNRELNRPNLSCMDQQHVNKKIWAVFVIKDMFTQWQIVVSLYNQIAYEITGVLVDNCDYVVPSPDTGCYNIMIVEADHRH